MDSWKLESAHDLGLPLNQRLRSVHREQGLLPYLTHLACSMSAKAILHLYHRLEIEGREHLPADGPFILASNHSSHLDVVVLASALNWRMRGNAFPIAAGDAFFQTPMIAAASAVFINALPMWRKNRSVAHDLSELRQRLISRRCVYIVFPEGTRSRTGEMSRFKSGLGMMVAATAVPVVPCRLYGSFESLPPGRRFPRPHKIRLRIGRHLEFQAMPSDRAGWNQIAQQVEAAVNQL